MDSSWDAIRDIRRVIGYSYPYKAGSVTINCSAYKTIVLKEVLDYFFKREFTMSMNKEKRQITITGYCKEF